MINFARRMLEKVENSQVKFWQILAWVYFAVLLRNLVESLTDGGGRVFNFYIFFVGYPIYYFANFLAIALVLYLFCRTEIYKIVKTIFIFSFFVVLAPLVDYLFPLYQNQSYGELTSLDLILKGYYTLGLGEFYLQGASFGVKIEFIVVLLGVFIYLLLKRVNWFLAFLGAVAAYAVIPTIGLFQTYFYFLYKSLGLEYVANYKPFALAQLYLAAIIIAIIFYLGDKNKFFLWRKTINWFRAALMVIMLALGLALYASQRLTLALFYSDPPLYVIKTVAAVLAVFLAWQIARLLNDLADFEADQASAGINSLNYLGRSDIVNIIIVYLAFFAGLALSVNYEFFVISGLAVALSYFYSFKPIQLKRHFVFASIASSLAYLLIFSAGYVVFFTSADTLNFIPKNLVYLLFVMLALAVSFKDVKDQDSDRRQGAKTLFTVFGQKKALWLIRLLILITALLPALFLKQWPLLATGFTAYLIIYAITAGFADISRKTLIFLTVIAYLAASVVLINAVKKDYLIGGFNLDADSGWHPQAAQETWFLSALLKDQDNNRYYFSQTFAAGVGSYLTLLGLNDDRFIKDYYPDENNLAITKNQFNVNHALPLYLQADQIEAKDNYGFKVNSFFGKGLLNAVFKNNPLNPLLLSPDGKIYLLNGSAVNYYALPSLSISGKIVFQEEKIVRVTGTGWLEHLWGSPKIDYQRWQIFNIDLNNGVKLVIANFGYSDKFITYGTMFKDGKAVNFNKLEIKPITFWQSPVTGKTWINELEISNPELGFKLELKAEKPLQEITEQEIWEGLMNVTGEIDGQAVTGWSDFRQIGALPPLKQ